MRRWDAPTGAPPSGGRGPASDTGRYLYSAWQSTVKVQSRGRGQRSHEVDAVPPGTCRPDGARGWEGRCGRSRRGARKVQAAMALRGGACGG